MRKTTWALLGFLIVLMGTLMGYQTGVIGIAGVVLSLVYLFAAAGIWWFMSSAYDPEEITSDLGHLRQAASKHRVVWGLIVGGGVGFVTLLVIAPRLAAILSVGGILVGIVGMVIFELSRRTWWLIRRAWRLFRN